MLHSMKISDLLINITTNLMPLIGKEPNPKLWDIYNQLQEWKFASEWKEYSIETNQLTDITESILTKLKSLSDRKLAQKIEDTITQYQPRAVEENIAYCGRIIVNWRVTESSTKIGIADVTVESHIPATLAPTVR